LYNRLIDEIIKKEKKEGRQTQKEVREVEG
jgi:hypothetical protein